MLLLQKTFEPLFSWFSLQSTFLVALSQSPTVALEVSVFPPAGYKTVTTVRSLVWAEVQPTLNLIAETR